MKKDKHFSLQEHQQLADELCKMRLTAIQYAVKISRAYPNISRQVRQVKKFQRVIDSLRCEMDNVFYREYPEKEFRKPYFEWVHTPYFNPEYEKRILSQLSVEGKEQDGLQ
jgi:hypothetical protein